MLATAVGTLPTGEGWAYEFKWDGVRALLDVARGRARITSRLGNDVSGGYPEVLTQAAGIGDVLLDGEIVAFVDGRPSFEQLQTRMHVRGQAEVARLAAGCPVTFVVFDLLRQDGTDLTGRPYRERRAALEAFVAAHPGWTISPSFDDGAATESVARAHGFEGVLAKRLASTYRPGARSEDWRKLRFVRAGDFAVLGWEAAAEHPNTLTSLVLGVTVADGLRFAGRVGSGLSGREAARVKERLTERAGPAVDGVVPPIRGRRVHWVEPEVVVEVEFLMWTDDGRLRAPVYRGIRGDKTVDEARGDG